MFKAGSLGRLGFAGSGRQGTQATAGLNWNDWRTRALLAVAGAICLLWPAVWNGYPITFADTGTYLAQAIRHYLGWDRPPFYSLFLFTFHLTISTWPDIFAQAAMTVYCLTLAWRVFAPSTPGWMVLGGLSLLSLVTPLPWYVSELMPDFLTGLLVIALAVLISGPKQMSRWEWIALVALSSWMIAAHLSNLWIACGLLLALLPLRRFFGATHRLGWLGVARAVAPVGIAVAALVMVNLIGFHRFSISPFGNVFVLSRLIYDGPGEATLERDCLTERWKICAYLRDLPPHDTRYPTSDFFLWTAKGPLQKLGGAKHFAHEAGEIITRTLQEHLTTVVKLSLSNLDHQFFRFRSGDGLNAWPDEVGPVIRRYFPAAENRAFLGSRQSQARLAVPAWLGNLHRAGFWVGIIATMACMVTGIWRRQQAALLSAAALLCMLGNAAVTGALSGPHDRYQNRIIWLMVFVPMVAGTSIGAGAKRRDLVEDATVLTSGSDSLVILHEEGAIA